MATPATKKNMVFERYGDLFVLLHTSSPPSDDEWRSFLDATAAATKENQGDVSRTRHLILTDGGGPSPAQRKESNDMLAGRPVRAAVVSGSPIVRGIVTAASWFNPRIRSFNTNEVQKAFEYLDIHGPATQMMWKRLRTLRLKLNQSALREIFKD